MDILVQSTNSRQFYWSLITSKQVSTFELRTTNFQGNTDIYEGSPHFISEQISRNLEIIMPPSALCQQTPRPRHGPKIEFQGETAPLGFRLMKQHNLSWNLEGTILSAPEPTPWFLPYDKAEIMRFGNSVNGAIPHDPDEAEFPDEPWPTDVVIRIKSRRPPQMSRGPRSTALGRNGRGVCN
jgi:hypothetical protein